MGVDKAEVLLPNGAQLIDVAWAALAGADSRFVVGGPRRKGQLGERHLVDRHPGEGPVAGVLTALDHVRGDNPSVILSCDLPGASNEIVQRLIEHLGAADCCVPLVGGIPQWLASSWSRSALPILSANFDRGARSFYDAVEGLSICWLWDSQQGGYRDVDTPADLKAWPSTSR